MKLKLHTQNTETLKTTLSLISPIRKFVILRFTPTQLLIISINGQSITLEPQVWCKLRIENLFDSFDIKSLRDNTVSLEINVELLLQALRNFDRSNSEGGLNIILQKKEQLGQQGVSTNNGRTGSLALFYSNTNLNTNTINHTFRIPVRILKSSHEALFVKEPELSNVDLIMKLPNEFATIYKRLDKFRKSDSYSGTNTSIGKEEMLKIRSSRRNGGFLGFILEEEGKFKVTISWNEKLDIQKPSNANFTSDSMRSVVEEFELASRQGREAGFSEDDSEEDKEIMVRLRDWRMASRIVASCKTVILMVSDRDSCVLHCFLDDSGDVEIMYYINGARSTDFD